jgi:hypothetical protein
MASIEKEEAVQAINFTSNSGTARKHDWRKGGLFRDFENFYFLHSGIDRPREKRHQSQILRIQSVTISMLLLLPLRRAGAAAIGRCWVAIFATTIRRNLTSRWGKYT